MQPCFSPSNSSSHQEYSIHIIVLTRTYDRGKCLQFISVQSLSHVRLFATAMNHSTPGLPVHHQLPEFTQTHVHRVGDAIQPSHPMSSPFPPAPNSSQHQGLFFAYGGQSIGVSASASVLPMSTQYWSPLGWTGWSIASATQWIWVWANLERQWRTGKPGIHQFLGSQSQAWLSDWTITTAI